MIRRTLRRFAASRRSAVAVIMAISLVPLMLLVGIAVDFTFLYQSRTQTAFASQAASTQALRIAAATYALEVANGSTSTVAAQHAIAAANTAGNLWFDANLGNLTRSSLTSRSTNTTFDGNTNGAINTNAPPNFAATVTDTATYPPIFNPIFGSTRNWTYSSNASGTTTYAYAQILLMLDTSGSMLIGADPPDIAKMEQGTVCPKQGYVVSTDAAIPSYNIPANFVEGNGTLSGGSYQQSDADGDAVNFAQISSYTPGATDNPATATFSGQCKPGFGLQSPTNYGRNQDGSLITGAVAATPCALACHFADPSVKSPSGIAPNGLPADYYGLARAEGVTLRIDVLFNATEQVIQDMQSSQAVPNQLSVGVYQFNTDVFPIVNGTTGSGGSLPEATSDLGSALTAVQAIDYKVTPTETAIPQLINGTNVSRTPSSAVANTGGDTNFPKSLLDLTSGNAFAKNANGGSQALTAAGVGATAKTPLKFMFIVTDGLEDDGYTNGVTTQYMTLYGQTFTYNVEGEMTSISDEAAKSGVCSYLKNTLGYTVYVLYVTYYPVANSAYYSAPTPGPRATNAAMSTDATSNAIGAGYINQSVQKITETPGVTTSPTAKALQACASSPTNFYQASSSSDIKTALNQMLKSALASTIRLTN